MSSKVVTLDNLRHYFRKLRDAESVSFPVVKEISESWKDLHDRIVVGDFSGINVGDYKTITLTTGEVVICEVAGIDTYYRSGDIPVGHHIDFISRDCLAGGKRMNATNDNNGTEEDHHPWMVSEMYKTLNNETTGVYSTLPVDLKPYIITKRALHEERYSSSGKVGNNTSYSYIDMGKLWLPAESEIYGHAILSDISMTEIGMSGLNFQYPIFASGTSHVIKCNGNGGSRCPWWTSSARMNDKYYFCYVNDIGERRVNGAASTICRVPLCFRIG